MVLRGRARRTVGAGVAAALYGVLSGGCAHDGRDLGGEDAQAGPRSRAHRELDTAGTVHVPDGVFLMGSTLDERAVALELAHAGRGRVAPEANAWIKLEYRQAPVETGPYWIMRVPVTQLDYLDHVRATGAAEPFVDAETWDRQGLGLPYAAVLHVAWQRGEPRPERGHHPVVLVDQAAAAAYCAWWGAARGGVGRLPTEAEWERAARGDTGAAYPWGDTYEPGRLDSADAGPGDTVPVGSYEEGASPYGALDMSGNVFEWTRSPAAEGGDLFVVKGGAYTTHADASRPAARHLRPAALRHVLIGFRCVLQAPASRHAGGDRPPRRSRRDRARQDAAVARSW